MKKIIIVSFLMIILFINSFGQWYIKDYKVTDINFLSKQQLEESLGKSKKGLLNSGIIAGIGGAIFLGAKYLPYEPSDDPTFLEQLIGDKGMNDIGIVTGAGILVGGTIASIAYLGRIGRIRSVINKNYPFLGSLKISPAIISKSYKRSSCPGLTLTCIF
jgi:hypothetical protein